MPALVTTGMSTGPKIRMVGVRSMTVPTSVSRISSANISILGWSITGSSRAIRSCGMSASVIM
ncbi:hypothetical protein D3C72_2164300 [compost metagenome]